jgi:alcohol dehydrogenase class IV
MPFEFATAGRIVFGRGAVRDAGAAAGAFGQRVLLVTGASPARAARARDGLVAAGLDVIDWATAGEPDTAGITRGVIAARDAGCDVIVGVGGGSVLDAAKAIAAIAGNDGDLFDYLEVIGSGRALTRPSLPVVAVPTTAGTGSEVTRNAVLTSTAHAVKVSLRSPHMLPRVAIVDPELTIDLPAGLTATTGLDALTQLIEAFVSNRANPLTDALCREGIRRAAGALPRACRDGTDMDAREDMALASLWSGMALANAALGAVHGCAGPLGGIFAAPHGALCAALLPHVMAANLAALRNAGSDTPAPGRFDEVGRLVTGRQDAAADDGIAWIRALCADLDVPGLATWGLTTTRIDEVVAKAQRASSMKGNPVVLDHDALAAVLIAAL